MHDNACLRPLACFLVTVFTLHSATPLTRCNSFKRTCQIGNRESDLLVKPHPSYRPREKLVAGRPGDYDRGNSSSVSNRYYKELPCAPDPFSLHSAPDSTLFSFFEHSFRPILPRATRAIEARCNFGALKYGRKDYINRAAILGSFTHLYASVRREAAT